MDMRIRSFGRIALFLTVAALATAGGCAPKTQALFTKPELITRGRLAVLGLTPEQEQIFMASYTKAFVGQIITFVERNRLHASRTCWKAGSMRRLGPGSSSFSASRP
ncbi:MAG: hypothetical protein ACYTEK_25650 [Planctomycetota bacterium]